MKKQILILFILPLLAGVTGDSRLYAQTWVVVGSRGFLTDPIPAAIAIDTGGTPYVVGTGAAKVMKFNSSIWVGVGTPVVPWSGAANTAMAIDRNGIPYVVYVDYDDDQKATVAKYNGSAWVTVGMAGFTGNPVTNTVIAIDTAGTPYVAYTDYGQAQKVTVMKFDGASWVTVGSPGFSAGASAYVSLAVSKSGTPYVVYRDMANGSFATAMAYNGSAWAPVGSPGFSDSSVQYVSLAIDTGGVPYVAYQDAMDGDKATVKQYNGASWVPVGITGLSPAGVGPTSIAIDKNNTIYLAFLDEEIGEGIIVMTYVGLGWAPIGNEIYEGGGDLTYCSMAIGNDCIPYVLYNDLSYLSVSKLDTALDPITGPGDLCVGATATLSELKGGGTWSSGDTSVVTIDSSGNVTGVSSGEVILSYTKAGSSATFTVFVDTLPLIRLILWSADSVCAGDSVHFMAEITGTWNRASISGTCSSLDTSIAVFTTTNIGGAWLSGRAPGVVPIEFIVTDNCGTDTTIYYYPVVAPCSVEVKNVTSPGSSFSIYPNPAISQLVVTSDRARINNIAISNFLGQKLFEKDYDATAVQVDIAALPPGLYLVRINGTEARKWMKE